VKFPVAKCALVEFSAISPRRLEKMNLTSFAKTLNVEKQEVM